MKTVVTKQRYLKRAQQLRAQASKDTECVHLSAQEWVHWLIKKQHHLSKASWRQYKASVCYYFEELIHNSSTSTVSRELLIDALNQLKQTLPTHCLKKSQATSAKKQKHINKVDLEKLMVAATNKKSRYGEAAVLWLFCGQLTGLRPTEWQHTEIEGQSLIVTNAKSTNGRAHSDKRKINLHLLLDTEWQALQQHLNNIRHALQSAGGFQCYYQHCRSALYELTRGLWPHRKKYITLYSGRHQFAANAKRSGFSKEIIAALMGHASIETAGSHYGRKVSGSPNGIHVSASLEDIECVKNLNQYRHEIDPLESGNTFGSLKI